MLSEQLKKEQEKLLKKAIKEAKDGDTKLLQFLLDRLLPKNIPQPVDKWKSPRAIYNALQKGKITPQLAEDYFKAIKSYLEIRDFRELEDRIRKLEKRR